MIKLIQKYYWKLGLFTLPFMCGCNGGGSSADSMLFSGGGLYADASVGAAGAAGVDAAASSLMVAQITNPEPASMMLVGGGMIALAALKRRKNSLK